MIILSIETSCDETAISLVEVQGDFPRATYHVIGDSIASQIAIHREFGGVFPSVAKREHAKMLVPMLARATASVCPETKDAYDHYPEDKKNLVRELLIREPGLWDALEVFIAKHHKPSIDLIAVTSGPGLEPALWVGINFAKALSLLWDIPVIPVNHMEGHIFSSLLQGNKFAEISFPALALLISGGHTEFIVMHDFGIYEKIGGTRDDAVGEAFDKTARMLGLPYPGGPEISRYASQARSENQPRLFPPLPRPMIHTPDLDFSFSGLKTAVRTRVWEKDIAQEERKALARDFEDSVTEVLIAKTRSALRITSAKTFIIGGGVTANNHIRDSFKELFMKEFEEVALYMPDKTLSTDNAIMIALSGHTHSAETRRELDSINAKGSLGFSPT